MTDSKVMLKTNSCSNQMPKALEGPAEFRHINDKTHPGMLHYLGKVAQTSLLCPVTTTATLAFRTAKLLTWVPAKACLCKVSGAHSQAATYFEGEYLKTVKSARDVLFLPFVARRAWLDMMATQESVNDDIKPISTKDYLSVTWDKKFEQYSSYLHGYETFQVIRPEGIQEFPAATDGSLRTVMASHLFKPDTLAINFGLPNVASFVTEETEDGKVQTLKVDAKSLRRAEMTYHLTNGKIQSGVFLVPTNLPDGALERYKKAAKEMQGRKDITCVNTNCRVLKEAGFSIEGVEMEGIIFPTTLMEHLLYRKVYYTDSNGEKHRVHFDIINTTQRGLQDHVKAIDTAVVGTRLRHRKRNADTDQNRKARGEAAKLLIAEEAERLANADSRSAGDDSDLSRRKVTVSVPSLLGHAIANIWGRHTIFEVSLADKKKQIAKTFVDPAANNESEDGVQLKAFPQQKPSFFTRLKRDLLFSRPVIRFLRGHMMGREDKVYLHTQDLFQHLKSTQGARLNYVLLKDKVVLARVHANGDSDEKVKKAADWALSKHALLANRQDVYGAGEMWYDEDSNCFMLNNDSGTYKPSLDRVKLVADLANEIFQTENGDYSFQAVGTSIEQ